MKKQILHLSHDDKFIDYLIESFNEISTVHHKYVIYTEKGVTSLKHIKSNRVQFAEKESETFAQLVGDIDDYQAVFVHYLSSYLSNIVVNASPDTVFYMVFWGSEVLTLPEFYSNSLLPKTNHLLDRIKPKFRFAFKPRNLKLELLRYFSDYGSIKIRKKAFERINFFCHWIPSDFEYIKSKIKLNATYIDFIYGTIDKVVGVEYNQPFKTDARDILIGNSANETNNHLDIFDQLNKCSVQDRKIYVPLSYSSIFEKYIDVIISDGKSKFEDQFIGITNFMQKSQYYLLLNSCEFIFMNHLRSQAGAVNRFVLYAGKKLFMNEQSNMYQYYKSIGLIVFSIDKEVVPENKDLWKSLSLEQKNHNRKILEECFGINSVHKRYKNILQNL